MLWLSLCSFYFLVSIVLHIGIDIAIIVWSTKDIVLIPFSFPYEVAAPLSLILVALSATFFILLIFHSSSIVLQVITPLTLLIDLIVMISITAPSSLDQWVNNIGSKWTNQSFYQSFQLENMCCGWASYTDRSIVPCPFTHRSGCSSIVTGWIKTRFTDSFYILLFTLALAATTYSTIIAIVYLNKVSSIWVNLEIPFFS